jgi:isocitrate dehydrogenase
LKTLEDGIHTYDIFKEGISKQKVGTKEFAQAVVERLGQKPVSFKPVVYNAKPPVTEKKPTFTPTVPAKKETMGVDVYIHSHTLNAEQLSEKLLLAASPNLKLKIISSRGQKVWPNGFAETFTVDHWRCRHFNPSGQPITHADIIQLLTNINAQGLDVIKTENLCTFDGEEGWTGVQGG